MKRRVLFLCTGNSCRSQMAEGVLRHLAGNRIEVASAGTHPVGLNPGAVEAMKEIGMEIAHHRSKSLEEFQGQPFDYVITVCDRAKESCPVFPGATTVLSWSVDDPAQAEGWAEAATQGRLPNIHLQPLGIVDILHASQLPLITRVQRRMVKHGVLSPADFSITRASEGRLARPILKAPSLVRQPFSSALIPSLLRTRSVASRVLEACVAT